MREIFLQRRQAFINQCLKYLKYVLNDHFVLFLLLGLGFVMVQYSQLLANLPKETLSLQLVLIFLIFGLGFSGDFIAYLENPDQLFLLAKEEDVLAQVKQAQKRGFLVWSLLELVLVAFLWPLGKGLGWNLWQFLLLFSVSLAIKAWVFQRRLRQLLSSRGLVWPLALEHELRQRQGVLKFFSLFTQVKGISQTVKRRACLDGVLGLFPKQTWTYLYARAFLRSGDYLTLSLRLFSLSLLGIGLLQQDMIATALVLLFNYLLLFQLVALYGHYRYQYLTQLFPRPLKEKKASLRAFLNGLFIVILSLQLVLALFFFQEKIYLLILLGGQGVLNLLYLPYKLEKLID